MAPGVVDAVLRLPGCTAVGFVVFFAALWLVLTVVRARAQQFQSAGVLDGTSLWGESFAGFAFCCGAGVFAWALCRVLWMFKG